MQVQKQVTSANTTTANKTLNATANVESTTPAPAEMRIGRSPTLEALSGAINAGTLTAVVTVAVTAAVANGVAASVASSSAGMADAFQMIKHAQCECMYVGMCLWVYGCMVCTDQGYVSICLCVYVCIQS
jgi:hypothetical protein